MQALAEFVFAVTSKGLVPVPEAVAQARNWLAAFPIVSADTKALDAAYSVVMTGRLSLFDALLVATAREVGRTILISEDMQDGATFDGLVVRNPFRADRLPEELRSLLGWPESGAAKAHRVSCSSSIATPSSGLA